MNDTIAELNVASFRWTYFVILKTLKTYKELGNDEKPRFALNLLLMTNFV